jgi:hypothetical protein
MKVVIEIGKIALGAAIGSVLVAPFVGRIIAKFRG